MDQVGTTAVGVGEIIDWIIKYGFPTVGVVVLWKAMERNRSDAKDREKDLRDRVRQLEDFIRDKLYSVCAEMADGLEKLKTDLQNKRETRRARKDDSEQS